MPKQKPHDSRGGWSLLALVLLAAPLATAPAPAQAHVTPPDRELVIQIDAEGAAALWHMQSGSRQAQWLRVAHDLNRNGTFEPDEAKILARVVMHKAVVGVQLLWDGRPVEQSDFQAVLKPTGSDGGGAGRGHPGATHNHKGDIVATGLAKLDLRGVGNNAAPTQGGEEDPSQTGSDCSDNDAKHTLQLTVGPGYGSLTTQLQTLDRWRLCTADTGPAPPQAALRGPYMPAPPPAPIDPQTLTPVRLAKDGRGLARALRLDAKRTLVVTVVRRAH